MTQLHRWDVGLALALFAVLAWSAGGCLEVEDDDGDDDTADDDSGDDDTADDDTADDDDDDTADDDTADDDSGDDDSGDDDSGDDDTDPYAYGDIPGYVEVTYAEDLACAGAHCYVAAKATGIVVVDVSDVSSPAVVHTVPSSDEAWDVALSGGHAFVADRDGGLLKLDLADPAQPTVAWTYSSTAVPRVDSVALNFEGDLVIGGGDGLDGAVEQLVDGAKAPTPSGSLAIPGEACVSLACTNAICLCGGGEGTLTAFDISTGSPAGPLGTFYDAGTPGHEPWGLGVAVDGSVVYYADWGAGLFAIDASDASNLSSLSSVSTADGFYDAYNAGPHTIDGTSYGKVLLGANAQGGLAVIDATNPTAMTLIGGAPLDVTVQMADGPHGVWAMGKYAYLADNMDQTLTIVRIED